MTSTRKLLSRAHFRTIPTLVQNSLMGDTQLNSRAPFCPKDLSGLATDLIKSYFEKGSIEEARTLFDEMSHRDVVIWTAMITGYTSCNHHNRAWSVFCEMLRHGTRPNAFTVSAVLKACKGLNALSCGKLVHGLAIKIGTQGSSIYVDNALMDLYATCCSSMDSARMVFEDIINKNAVSWTTLITGHTHRGDAYGGLRAFRQMFLVTFHFSSSFLFAIYVYFTQINCLIIAVRRTRINDEEQNFYGKMICHAFISWMRQWFLPPYSIKQTLVFCQKIRLL